MKKWLLCICLVLLLVTGLWAAKFAAEFAVEKSLEKQVIPAAAALPEETTVPETTIPETTVMPEPTTVPTAPPTEAPTETTQPQLLTFTEEEETLLLKIGMAERGSSGCTECIALVMRTVLNRMDSPRFSSTLRGVIYAQDQFTPVAEGTFESVIPNDRCREALDMVKRGWDESQGALYYEWCEGESWHSRNLNLLFQHCDVRFYN